MLHIHHSNRTEALLASLCDILASPLKRPLQPELIVVEEPGMARWLAQQIATAQGLAANIEFPLPAAFIWRVLRNQLSRQSAEAGFNKTSLMWMAMSLLPGLKKQPGFDAIQRYLDASDEETKRYQLSRQIADLFDQYLIYRPDMILEWESGNGDNWQAQLWCAMREHSDESHWAALLAEFSNSIQTGGFNSEGLPERVSLFALSSLSPGYIELLSLVAEYMDIHLFVVNPSYAYWGDIVSDRDLARLRDRWRSSGRPDVSELYMVGNPLLASMGKPCRDFLDSWHDYAANEYENFIEAGEGSLLSLIQGDILNLQSKGGDGIPVQSLSLDDSLQIHACHSPMREVQVLHDRLLGLFDGRTDLSPHEIVVMAPDINSYAPYIEAVFGSTPAERHIPYSVAGQVFTSQPLVETFLSWLQLPDERFEAPTVMGWLEVTSVQSKLRLDTDGLERIRQWISESGIRWGLDGAHKSELGLPDNENNTWRFGFKRLFLGYAMPATTELYDTVAPYGDIEGGEVAYLGQLQDFIEQLANWRKIFSSKATTREWQARINQLIEQFFAPDQHEELFINTIRESMARVVETSERAGFEEKISAQLMHQQLSNMLSAPGHTYRMLAGRVTFCDMVPVRSIPFRVVCMLGMNDGDFPRNQRPRGFDLIAQNHRKGDRSLREGDRYLFLESLLAAREVLHISYVGRSQQDNSERLPSVVVAELLDYVEQGYEFEGDEDVREKLIHEHSLQPFSPRNFEQGSYASEWLERSHESKTFLHEPLIQKENETRPHIVTISALTRFLTNPARHFLENSLGVNSAEYEEAMEDSECFSLDALTAYALKSELLSAYMNQSGIEERFALYEARGELPHGGLAKISYDNAVEGIKDLSERVREHLTENQKKIDIELIIEDTLLTGSVENVVDGSVIRYRPAGINGKDRLSLWVLHLTLCASGECAKSHHLGKDSSFTLLPVDADEARRLLAMLLSLHREGSSSPVPLLLQSSFAYAETYKKKSDSVASLSAAKSKWSGGEYSKGDGDDPWNGQAFRDNDPYDAQFEQVARDVVLPIIEYKE